MTGLLYTTTPSLLGRRMPDFRGDHRGPAGGMPPHLARGTSPPRRGGGDDRERERERERGRDRDRERERERERGGRDGRPGGSGRSSRWS